MRRTKRAMCAAAIACILLGALPVAAQLKTTALGKDIGAAVLLVTDSGFRPASITLPNKPHILVVQNRTGLRKMHVSLTQAAPLTALTAGTGTPPSELTGVDHKNGAQDQTIMLNALPGTYYLTVKEKPALQVKIVVQ